MLQEIMVYGAPISLRVFFIRRQNLWKKTEKTLIYRRILRLSFLP